MATRRSTLALERQHAAKDFVMLAHKLDESKHVCLPFQSHPKNVHCWMIQEKFDGVRVRWHEGQFFSRSKKPYPCPAPVLAIYQKAFGDLELDGELSLGRGQFQKTVSIVRNGGSSLIDWLRVKFNIFDLVDPGVEFYDRYQVLLHLKEQGAFPMVAKLAPLLGTVESFEQLKSLHDSMRNRVLDRAEGLILRNPIAKYEFGRSHNLLKYKVKIEIDAKVIDHTEGEGQHQGLMGACVCVTRDGVQFKVGSGFTFEDRDNPPPLGSIICVEFFEYTDDGLPRFPVYKGPRPEGDWV